MNITAEMILAIVAILGSIGTAISFFLNRNNVHAETLSTLSDTLTKLSVRVAELEEDGRKDNARIQTLEHLLSLCVIGLQTLTNQIIREGSKPEWIPPTELDLWMTHYIQSSKHKEPNNE